MEIKSLELQNFRNYPELKIEFDEKTNIIYGDNAQGKTNILEAIYLCATSRSHKGAKDKEMIRFGEDEAHIKMIVQKSAFLASEAGVALSIHFKKKLGVGLFGGEGFIMQRLSGNGVAFVEIDGELVEYDLRPGEQLVVDTGNVAGFTPGVQMDIQQVPGMKNALLGGEGLFNTLLTGPGKVWLQTMPISNVAASITPYIPTGNG